MDRQRRSTIKKIEKNGACNWTKCSEYIKGRSGKQCREHWNNSLDPKLIKGQWTSEEDLLILIFYEKYGGSWKKIIPIFDKRTENSIKNRFFSQLRKIASKYQQSRKKEYSSRFGLEDLKNFLPLATDLAKKKFFSENNNNQKIDENLLGLNDEQNQNKRNENNNIGENNEDIDEVELNKKYENYPEKIVEIINKIREDPVGYADTVEKAIENITSEPDKEDPSINRLIYKKKLKVALTKGEPVFREAIDYLRTLTPLPPLQFSNEKCIPLPETEEEMKDPTFLRNQVRTLREKTKIDVFFKDLIKIPEISGLLMIVDDTNKNAGKKRKALLNKELKYIGVNSKFIGKTFIAYFSFSKE